MKKSSVTALLLLFSALSFGAQEYPQETFNPIPVGTPLLSVSPDSRASAMGETGVATKPDANSQHWNAAKYAFIERRAFFVCDVHCPEREVAERKGNGLFRVVVVEVVKKREIAEVDVVDQSAQPRRIGDGAAVFFVDEGVFGGDPML
jgi:hypothetical protein